MDKAIKRIEIKLIWMVYCNKYGICIFGNGKRRKFFQTFWQIELIIIVILEEITIDFKQKSESKAPVPICILFRFLIDSML